MNRGLGLPIAVAAVLWLGVASAAADYPVSAPTLVTSDATPTAGAPITLTVSGWCLSATVVFTTDGVTLGSATTDAAGTASITINAPTSAGAFDVTASSSGSCVASASVSMSVVTPGPGLPRTGSGSTISGLLLGAAAVGSGAALIGLAGLRRRRVVAS